MIRVEIDENLVPMPLSVGSGLGHVVSSFLTMLSKFPFTFLDPPHSRLT